MKSVQEMAFAFRGLRHTACAYYFGLDGARSTVLVVRFLPARPAAEDAIGAGQGQAGDQRGFEGQGAQVFGLEVVHVALAAGAGEDLDLGGQGVEEVGDALGGLRSISRRAASSGSWVVMPTGHRPVWQWWHE